ncbi:MAG: aminotransferase class I/II-fold pyridoxal phosphate-dependent enzyme [Deltaproteobacteria bacterium]|nr:aminotransferase class I/II-fold pyridoxal phosphate-dependent enzyme [Deltaproteobacteria bacterium]
MSRPDSIFRKIDTYSVSLEAKKLGIYPYFREITSEQNTEVRLKQGGNVLMLGSNNYLGLANHPEVKEAAIKATEKYGATCAGSRFLNGTLDLHTELESELAAWVGKESALLYTTGFQVGQGVLAAILGRRDHVLLDRHNHASILDGAKLSPAAIDRYMHNDMEHLEELLSHMEEDQGRMIVVDGVFSMEGDIVRLPRLLELADTWHAAVMVDDAHGLGVLGELGRGTASFFGLTDKVDLIMGTLSKSLASVGGFVAADEQTIEYLKHHSRALIFSASMPPSSAAAALAALKVIKREPERIERLWENTERMRRGLTSLGYDTGLSETPIIPIHVGNLDTLARMFKRLETEGIFVNPIIPPAVPPNHCLLRISLMATHSPAQIDRALDILGRVGRELNVIR